MNMKKRLLVFAGKTELDSLEYSPEIVDGIPTKRWILSCFELVLL
jgi:hypothetical protein